MWLAAAAAIVIAGGARIDGQQSPGVRVTLARPDSLDPWELVGSGTWASADGVLRLDKPGTPLPAGSIRRPAALAILKTPALTSARLDVDLRCTAPVDVVYRDLELIFGYASPTRFYYVHLAGITDAVHNGVFLVNDADRRRIDRGTTPPQLKDQAWHHLRLDWQGAAGRVEIFVDGSSTAAFDVTDRTIAAGRVGLGSFDDTGEFRGIDLSGSAVPGFRGSAVRLP